MGGIKQAGDGAQQTNKLWSLLRHRRLRALATSLSALGAAYLCVGTSCAPEAWSTQVETLVEFQGRSDVSIRLEAEVGGTVQQVKLRASPDTTIVNVVSVPWLVDASPAASTALSAVPAASVTLAGVPPLTGAAASAANGAALAVHPQADGSVIVDCGADPCHALLFSVRPASTTTASTRVHADVSGHTAQCGDQAPSSLRVELKELPEIVEASP